MAENVETKYAQLQRVLVYTSLFNFLVLALVGLWLRAYPIFSIGIFSYKNVLHAHSHFAFGGWLMPALLALVLKFFPRLCTHTAYPHWRRIIVIILTSAYGMLLSFPFQGYGVVSIIFSTLSLTAGFYTGFLICSKTSQYVFVASGSFLRAAFFYYFISAAGPFATGPLIAMGKAGSDLYYNAIYFYLHFQYNGFFTFVVLSVLYKVIELSKPFNNGKSVFKLMNFACLPAFTLSVLWTEPSIVVNVIGAVAALMQIVASWQLLKDLKGTTWITKNTAGIFRLAILAFITKNLLQLLSALPEVAQLAFQYRNFIIAYLHLVLIGFVSMFIFSLLPAMLSISRKRWFTYGNSFFVFGFFSIELLLVLQAAGLLHWLPGRMYTQLLFLFSIFFPLGLLVILLSVQKARYFNPVRLLQNQ